MADPEGLGPINAEMEESIENFNAKEKGGMRIQQKPLKNWQTSQRVQIQAL